jgi:predicted dehydrogenase
MSDEVGSTVSRREFLRFTAGATSAVSGVLLGSTALPAPAAAGPAINARIIGANDRVHVGIIGVKGMGGGHLRNLVGDEMKRDNVDVIAVCDVWETARTKAQAAAGCPSERAFADYRRLLDVKEIDAVVVATPDHWHGRMGVAALEAGKHLYIEKPMTRRLDEAFKMHDAAKRTRRLVQVGSHGCSDPKYLRARDVVREGALGRLLWAQGSYCRNNPKGEWNYALEPDATERTVDWRAWLGPARKRPWSAERFFRWRKYWDYGTGVIGDLWPHRLHPLLLAMDLNEFPRSVSCVGGDLCAADEGRDASGARNGERREVADTTMMMAEFPCGVMIFLAGSTVNERGVEDVIRGQKANLTLGGGRLQIVPERPFVDEVDASDRTPADAGETHVKHMRNFLDSIRANVPPNCNEDLGIRVQTIVSMAEAAYRRKRLVRFDEAERKMIV